MNRQVMELEKELKLLCKSYLKLLRDNSALLEIMLSMKSESPAELFNSRFYTAISPLDVDKETASDLMNLLVDYLHGVALAMKCNSDDESLIIDSIDGPLHLYFKLLS